MISVGHCVTVEHPLIVLHRWNTPTVGEPAATTVPNWHAPLGADEEAALAAAGIDPASPGLSERFLL